MDLKRWNGVIHLHQLQMRSLIAIVFLFILCSVCWAFSIIIVDCFVPFACDSFEGWSM